METKGVLFLSLAYLNNKSNVRKRSGLINGDLRRGSWVQVVGRGSWVVGAGVGVGVSNISIYQISG